MGMLRRKWVARYLTISPENWLIPVWGKWKLRFRKCFSSVIRYMSVFIPADTFRKLYVLLRNIELLIPSFLFHNLNHSHFPTLTSQLSQEPLRSYYIMHSRDLISTWQHECEKERENCLPKNWCICVDNSTVFLDLQRTTELMISHFGSIVG